MNSGGEILLLASLTLHWHSGIMSARKHALVKGDIMELKPLADRIVAKPLEAETKTAAGILLPDQAKDKTQLAQVVAVGKEVKEVKVGDKILHAEYGPDHFKHAADDYLIVKEKDVLAVING
jgi:chaperonin GroES